MVGYMCYMCYLVCVLDKEDSNGSDQLKVAVDQVLASAQTRILARIPLLLFPPFFSE